MTLKKYQVQIRHYNEQEELPIEAEEIILVTAVDRITAIKQVAPDTARIEDCKVGKSVEAIDFDSRANYFTEELGAEVVES